MKLIKPLSLLILILYTSLSVHADMPDHNAENIAKYKKLCRDNIHGIMKEMYREPSGSLQFPFIVPGSSAYLNNLWDWDSWLSDIALRQILLEKGSKDDWNEALRYEQGCILNALSYGGADGYIPITLSPSSPSRYEMISSQNIYEINMHKPCLAQHAAFIIKNQNNDAEWIRDSYNLLAAFEAKYMNYHRHIPTGLLYWENDEMIGVDNDPSTFYRPARSSGSIFLNALMYKELLAMEYISKSLGMTENAKDYARQASDLAASINTYCWDPRDGFYYSVDFNLLPVEKPTHSGFTLHQGAPREYSCLIQRFSVWSGFLGLWSGIATPEMAKQIVEKNYRDSLLFNAPAGVYTLSPQEKMYSIKASGNPSSWLGPIWSCVNYFVWRGLVDYGYEDDAKELAEKTILLLGRDFERFGTLHEYYDPKTGEPILNRGFQNWNLLVLNMIAWLDGRPVVREF